MVTKLQILRGARELLAQPCIWTKGEIARNKDGDQVNPNSPDACQFCAMGAVIKVLESYPVYYGEDPEPLFDDLVQDIEMSSDGSGLHPIAQFNDSQESVCAVLGLFDKTIARLEEEANA